MTSPIQQSVAINVDDQNESAIATLATPQPLQAIPLGYARPLPPDLVHIDPGRYIRSAIYALIVAMAFSGAAVASGILAFNQPHTNVLWFSLLASAIFFCVAWLAFRSGRRNLAFHANAIRVRQMGLDLPDLGLR